MTNDLKLDPDKFYRVYFTDGQPIDFRFIGKDADNGSILCMKKGGETFYLDVLRPFEKVVEIDNW